MPIMNSAQVSDLTECVEYIEKAVLRGEYYREISIGIEIHFNSRYGTLRNYFYRFMPCSLSKYIKRRLLTEGYLRYKDECRSINISDNYYGFNRFSAKFEKEFGCPVDGDYERSDLQEVVDVSEIETIHDVLSRRLYIDSYEINTKSVVLHENLDMKFEYLISLESFLLPIAYKGFFSELDTKQKRLFLCIASKAARKEPDDLRIEMPFDDIKASYNDMSLGLYNLDACSYVSNSLMIFAPLYNQYHKLYFLSRSDEFLPALRISVPAPLLRGDALVELDAISNAISFGELSSQLGCSDTESRLLVWNYLNVGLLRNFPLMEE